MSAISKQMQADMAVRGLAPVRRRRTSMRWRRSPGAAQYKRGWNNVRAIRLMAPHCIDLDLTHQYVGQHPVDADNADGETVAMLYQQAITDAVGA